MSTTQTSLQAPANGLHGPSAATSGHTANQVRPGPDQPAWQWNKLLRLARRQIEKLLMFASETLQDGSLGAVDKMRITSRRLGPLLDLLYPKPRPRRIKKLRRRLKAWRRALGELRNNDALLAMAEHSAGLKPASHREVWMALSKYLQERRRAPRCENSARSILRLPTLP